ncbi:hypothetical protein PYCC9005_002675 [Savitreella phatthalungensis]
MQPRRRLVSPHYVGRFEAEDEMNRAAEMISRTLLPERRSLLLAPPPGTQTRRQIERPAFAKAPRSGSENLHTAQLEQTYQFSGSRKWQSPARQNALARKDNEQYNARLRHSKTFNGVSLAHTLSYRASLSHLQDNVLENNETRDMNSHFVETVSRQQQKPRRSTTGSTTFANEELKLRCFLPSNFQSSSDVTDIRKQAHNAPAYLNEHSHWHAAAQEQSSATANQSAAVAPSLPERTRSLPDPKAAAGLLRSQTLTFDAYEAQREGRSLRVVNGAPSPCPSTPDSVPRPAATRTGQGYPPEARLRQLQDLNDEPQGNAFQCKKAKQPCSQASSPVPSYNSQPATHFRRVSSSQEKQKAFSQAQSATPARHLQRRLSSWSNLTGMKGFRVFKRKAKLDDTADATSQPDRLISETRQADGLCIRDSGREYRYSELAIDVRNTVTNVLQQSDAEGSSRRPLSAPRPRLAAIQRNPPVLPHDIKGKSPESQFRQAHTEAPSPDSPRWSPSDQSIGWSSRVPIKAKRARTLAEIKAIRASSPMYSGPNAIDFDELREALAVMEAADEAAATRDPQLSPALSMTRSLSSRSRFSVTVGGVPLTPSRRNPSSSSVSAPVSPGVRSVSGVLEGVAESPASLTSRSTIGSCSPRSQTSLLSFPRQSPSLRPEDNYGVATCQPRPIGVFYSRSGNLDEIDFRLRPRLEQKSAETTQAAASEKHEPFVVSLAQADEYTAQRDTRRARRDAARLSAITASSSDDSVASFYSAPTDLSDSHQNYSHLNKPASQSHRPGRHHYRSGSRLDSMSTPFKVYRIPAVPKSTDRDSSKDVRASDDPGHGSSGRSASLQPLQSRT